MCLLMVKPAGKSLTREQIADFNAYNPDGFGVMWAEGGKVHVIKTLGKVRKQWKILNKRGIWARDAVLHWRQATHGATDYANCHPFHVAQGVQVAHNGIISDVKTAPGQSDTRAFIEQKLIRYVETAADLLFCDKEVQDALAKRIGTFNKMVFLGPDGQRTIINEDEGLWEAGIWYSNTYAWTNNHSFSYYTHDWMDDWRTSLAPPYSYDSPYWNPKAVAPACAIEPPKPMPAEAPQAVRRPPPSSASHDVVIRGALQDLEDAVLDYSVRGAVKFSAHYAPDWLLNDVADTCALAPYDPDILAQILRGYWRDVYDWARG